MWQQNKTHEVDRDSTIRHRLLIGVRYINVHDTFWESFCCRQSTFRLLHCCWKTLSPGFSYSYSNLQGSIINHFLIETEWVVVGPLACWETIRTLSQPKHTQRVNYFINPFFIILYLKLYCPVSYWIQCLVKTVTVLSPDSNWRKLKSLLDGNVLNATIPMEGILTLSHIHNQVCNYSQ